jgi:hypothetical protein
MAPEGRHVLYCAIAFAAQSSESAATVSFWRLIGYRLTW